MNSIPEGEHRSNAETILTHVFDYVHILLYQIEWQYVLSNPFQKHAPVVWISDT